MKLRFAFVPMANKMVTVAGVQFPDTTLCNAAIDLLAETSPKFLYNHCFRTYVFGRSP